MPKSRLELVTKAVRFAQGLGTGQVPEAEDVAEMKDNLAPTIAMLLERRVVDATFILVGDESAPIIPEAWYLPLARVLAFQGADTLGAEELQSLTAFNAAAQDTFHEMADVPDPGTPIKACYF